MIKRRHNPEKPFGNFTVLCGTTRGTKTTHNQKGGINMKKMFEECTIAVIFMTVCCGIAALMGLIEAHDKKRSKRRPMKPMQIFVYTAERIRRVTKHITAPFRRRRDHLVWFEDGTRRLSPEMMSELEKAPVYTMEELERICSPSPTPQKILI